MRLVSFEADGTPMAGIRIGDEVAALGDPATGMKGLLAAGTKAIEAMAANAPRRKLSSVTLLPPVRHPGKIICIGLNYALHAKEGNNPIPDYPAIFLRATTSLVAPGGAMIRPRASDKFDYEAELAIVIGQRCRNVSEAQALDYVGGYSCFNEGSIRDFQRKSTQWGAGKNFDGTGAFGPEIVTPDELPPGADNLRIMTRLNGETMQDSTTGDMIFKVANIVSTLSVIMTLEPGDVIATGTPSGVGYARKPPRFLTPGDTVEVEIEGIGVLRNSVADEA